MISADKKTVHILILVGYRGQGQGFHCQTDTSTRSIGPVLCSSFCTFFISVRSASLLNCEQQLRFWLLAMASSEGKLYLGFDFSTQQIKVIAVTEKFEVAYDEHVQFDVDLPEFKTHGGVHIQPDHVTITTPTRMWVKAFDLLLERMKASKFPFQNVVAVSGAGQQHGSVFWSTGVNKYLRNLSPDQTMYEQLKDCFSVEDSPVWMDASTRAQCKKLEQAVGGPEILTGITGSRAYERFTGAQIMKICETRRDAYDNTERISLVSSFAASLFIGDYAPIDHSDATGTNLLDIWSRDWSQQCLEACGPNLAQKLGPSVHSSEKIGQVSDYLVSRYGFNPDCIVTAFVGDNPASLAGLAPGQGDVIVSLGTSDTVFLWLTKPTPGLSGHIMANPLNRNDFMSLTCFKNGSLTRERIRDEKAGGSWEKFSEMLKKTPPGNNGVLGIYFDQMEIQPFIEGEYRFDGDGSKVDSFPPEVEVRAVIEGQFIARKVHAENVGFQLGPKTRIIATGGGSKNQEILQVLADIFNSPVYVKDVPNSAGLGCAMRAMHTLEGGNFSDMAGKAHPSVLVASPGQYTEVYAKLSARYREFEKMAEDGSL
ncbi:xylulose kinase [Plakobranchus ocellatus]|uniref:Xylulose kinase n=1 Tax=Plakobranchus ocellatus TaxID=259542 RepID=A0AAV3ZFR2_9GAST|nr:xylulose kinase [Plakobranchus ocellatus]